MKPLAPIRKPIEFPERHSRAWVYVERRTQAVVDRYTHWSEQLKEYVRQTVQK